MTPLASALLFILAVVVLGFVLRAVTLRNPPAVLTAEISPLRCGCNPKSEHPQLGARPIPCTDEEADWWVASETEDGCVIWSRTFDSRAEAENAVLERCLGTAK